MHSKAVIHTISITLYLIIHFLPLEEVAVMGLEIIGIGSLHVVKVLKKY
jgi:hypothetical protein